MLRHVLPCWPFAFELNYFTSIQTQTLEPENGCGDATLSTKRRGAVCSAQLFALKKLGCRDLSAGVVPATSPHSQQLLGAVLASGLVCHPSPIPPHCMY